MATGNLGALATLFASNELSSACAAKGSGLRVETRRACTRRSASLRPLRAEAIASVFDADAIDLNACKRVGGHGIHESGGKREEA